MYRVTYRGCRLIDADGNARVPDFATEEEANTFLTNRATRYGNRRGRYAIERVPEVESPTAGKTPGTPYYGTLTPEPIDVIEGWGLDYSSGNAIKYIARAGRKSTEPAEVIKDLEKAISYLRRRINALNGTRAW